ncbi:MAG: exo-alpha-sialidase, partial [Thermoleophilaceae bacterium]|nr:exo-alpha-sialidase [Thermoleophilaceae bacterium]
LLLSVTAVESATPAGATLSPDANGAGRIGWTGVARTGSAANTADEGESCFGTDRRPSGPSGCDLFRLDVSVPADFYRNNPGSVQIDVGGFGVSDLDLYVYKRNPDGTRGEFVAGDGQLIGLEERVVADRAEGAYYVAVVPYTVLGEQPYSASAKLITRRGPGIDELNRRAPRGVPNVRASRDRYTSHSEPTIAMDPLDHDHLIAGSKMYENNEKYLFKVGTYESFDGGRRWTDQGHLPGYCQAPGQCDPSNEVAYRTTSDPTIAFDDEGTAYANVLDAPGGTNSFQGFNMTVHTKRRGMPWSGPTTVHDNRVNGLTEQLLLDDKNWIAVDNVRDTRGGPNRQGDGKTGTIYICWSFDGTGVGPAPLPLQQIVVMRSLDGGKTWGGARPGDNTPQFISQKTLVSGIGCHVAIGPTGEVYATWYDNQLNALMQAKSTNRGRSWTPAAPIAGIEGVNDPFEGESFRNLSIPTTAVDPRNGHVYVAAASRNAEGNPLLPNVFAVGKLIKQGKLTTENLRKALTNKKANDVAGRDYKAGGDGFGPLSGADIVLFKSVNGGRSYTGPVRVNQDPRNSDADQFQPWMAVTDRGQVNVSFFDRRNDPANYFIDTWLARSNDGGRTFGDTRVSQQMWDPAVNAPTSVSGKFIGDYQGLVADDDVAIPFWNDTQLNNLPKSSKEFSPYQEVFSARVPNRPERAGVRSRCFPRRLRIGRRAIGRASVGARRATVLRRLGPPRARRGNVWRYCVRGGGRVLLVFSKRKRVTFVASTARGHRRRGVGPRSTVRRLRAVFRRAGVRSLPGGILRVRRGSSRQILFGTRRGRVRYVAVADRATLRKRSR